MQKIFYILLCLFLSLSTSKAQQTKPKKAKSKLDSLSKELSSPQIIHISTHGFFVPDSEADTVKSNPLLRAGLMVVDSIKKGNEFKYLHFNTAKEETKLFVFSVVDPDTYDHWEERKENFKKFHQTNDYLLAVAKADSRQKMEFMMKFYELEGKLGREQAYLQAVEYITQEYKELDFKHYFGKKIK